MSDDSQQIRYYDYEGRLLAAVGDFAQGGLFRLVGTLEKTWQWLDTNSPIGDAMHQAIYLAHDADWLPTPPADLPPLPLDAPVKSAPRESFFQRRPAVPVAEAPDLVRLMRKTQLDELVAYIVLHEDMYESRHGDGIFRYLDSAYLLLAEAQKRVNASNDGTQYHLRKLLVTLDGDVLKWRDFKLEVFDHYDPNDVIRMLEARA